MQNLQGMLKIEYYSLFSKNFAKFSFSDITKVWNADLPMVRSQTDYIQFRGWGKQWSKVWLGASSSHFISSSSSHFFNKTNLVQYLFNKKGFSSPRSFKETNVLLLALNTKFFCSSPKFNKRKHRIGEDLFCLHHKRSQNFWLGGRGRGGGKP